MTRETLSRAEARRVTLAAQGFAESRPDQVTMAALTRTVRRTGVLQIDSVNVLTRAHYMPIFSRLGGYDPDLLHRAAGKSPRRLVEYWAHVAAFMPVELWPLMRHRMRRYAERGHAWMGLPENPALTASLLAEVRERGASTARDLDDGLPRSKEHWGWNWSDTKTALEYLFLSGELAVAGRNGAFERLYDLPGRVVPRQHLEAPEPPPEEAHRALVLRAARSYGVATEQCLRDYFRMELDEARTAVQALVADGELVPVRVEGWGRPAYLHPSARVPRAVEARALLSPFDPLVWERSRTEAIFGFRYRIEIYVPQAQRVHGYYVLPFLLGDALVARVDLKADRASRTLVVAGAFAEPDAAAETAAHLAAELVELARWQGLTSVVVGSRGDLAPALAAALGHGPGGSATAIS